MKLVLHIGTEKTGTTSLQHWAHRNADILRAEGVWIARTIGVPDNRALSVVARDADMPEDGFHRFGVSSPAEHATFRRETKAALLAEISQARDAGMRIFFISNEHLQSRLVTQTMVDRVAALLKPVFDEIEVICFLRPQIDTAISLASTGARVGLQISRRQFETIKADGAYYNFSALLDRWATAFGEDAVIPVPFKRNKNTVAWFRDRFSLVRDDYAPEEKANSALDYRVIALGNRLNLPRFIAENQLNPNRGFYMEDFPFEEPLTLSRDFAKSVHQRFVPYNREIFARWPQINWKDLTPDWDRFPEVGTVDLLETCDIGPVLRYVIQRFNADLQIARAQNDHLKARLAERGGKVDTAIAKAEEARAKLARAAVFEPVAERARALDAEVAALADTLRAESAAGAGNGAAKPGGGRGPAKPMARVAKRWKRLFSG